MVRPKYYFTTRDLLQMAALAALGGVSGTYINAVGDAFQATLGFAGTMQWAAGLHVLWLTLAMGLTGKVGAGTVTGILKGVVELLSGNTHGLLILLIDIVAGLLVDAAFLPFRNKDSLVAYLLAGGLASASNVFVFQLFASLPADLLAYGAILLVAGMAFASGTLFAGLLARGLVGALRRAGVVKDRAPVRVGRWVYPVFFVVAAGLALVLALYLRQALRGPATIPIAGAVEQPYRYAQEDMAETTADATLRETTTEYKGVPLREVLARAEPAPDASMLLVQATDGYAFFISMDEVRENDALLLSCQGKGEDASCNIVGAQNSKAWVRGVSKLTLIAPSNLQVSGALAQPGIFDPDEWQFEMDSIRLDVGGGARKVQGAPLGKVIQSMEPLDDAETVVVYADDGSEQVVLPLSEVCADDDVRIFTIIGQEGISFAVARMNGEVLVPRVDRIQVQ